MIKDMLRKIFGFPVHISVSCNDCSYLEHRTFWYLSTQEWLDNIEASHGELSRNFDNHECERVVEDD